MKNSLFKRAIAVASAVPVALTQCLSVANAVYVDYSVPTATKGFESTSLTLDNGDATSILYIAPEEDYAFVENYEVAENTFSKAYVKSSDWNSRLSKVISSVALSDNKNGVIDLTEVYNAAINASGAYKDVTKSLIEKIGEITYSVSEDGKITIEGTLDNITSTYTAGGSNTIGGALKDLAAEYGVEDLETPENFFDDIFIGCSAKIVVDASTLADDTSVIASLELTDTATGKVYKGIGAIDWALNGLDILKNTAKDVCDQYSEYIDTTDAYKQVDDSVSFYVDKLELAKKYIDKAYTVDKSVSAEKVKDLITEANEILDSKIGKTLPGTDCSEIAANDKVKELYNNALAQVNDKVAPYTIDISAKEIGEFGDAISDIEASVSNGVATLSAKLVDKEAADVEDYIENNYNVDVIDVYKTISVVVDASNATDELGGFVSSDVRIERVVLVDELAVTTTTTTETETSITTTTTVTETDTDTDTTTTVTETDTDTDTTTTVTETDTDTDTTTTVTETDTDTATTTTVTETDTDTATTTTVTETDTTTATTTTGDIVVPGSSTTRTETKYVINYTTETVTGFYLDIDPEFNIEQVKSLGYSVDYSILSYDEEGALVQQEILIKGDEINIIDLVEFKDVPADVFKLINEKNVNQFASQIQLYAKEDIVAADGTVVANAGDALKNVDGSPVSVTAYIGVKGDADLDMKADSADASTILAWYASVQTGGKPAELQFSNNDLLVQNNPVLDDFAAFLADVDNENDSANYVTLKTARTIDPSDSSFILDYYAKVQTGYVAGRDTWNEVLGEYGKN